MLLLALHCIVLTCGVVPLLLQPEVKRLWGRRQRHYQQPAQLKPLESARFKLQKPISKKLHHHHRPQKQQQRRRWWSSAASAALHLFKKRPSSSTTTRPAPAAAPTPYPPYGSTAAPLYLADYDAAGGDDDDGGAAACTCWAPAVRSGGSRLAAAELGAAAVAVPYVSLRSTSSLAGARTTGGAPVMPIYLVT